MIQWINTRDANNGYGNTHSRSPVAHKNTWVVSPYRQTWRNVFWCFITRLLSLNVSYGRNPVKGAKAVVWALPESKVGPCGTYKPSDLVWSVIDCAVLTESTIKPNVMGFLGLHERTEKVWWQGWNPVGFDWSPAIHHRMFGKSSTSVEIHRIRSQISENK